MKRSLFLLLAIILVLPCIVFGKTISKISSDAYTYEKDITIEMEVNDTYDVSEFFNREEIKNVDSTNPEIAEIKKKELVVYKVGKTDLIDKDNDKVLHLIVTNGSIFRNPKTTATSIFAIIVGVSLITILTFSKKKYFE